MSITAIKPKPLLQPVGPPGQPPARPEVASDFNECLSCLNDLPPDECLESMLVCGHHCNHTWTHDECCWCGASFGDEDDPDFGVPGTGPLWREHH